VTDELPIVKRLRGINREVKSNGYCDRIRNPDGAEAADIITELVAALEQAERWIVSEGCLSEPFNAQQQKVLKPIRAVLEKVKK
jgi:hypothetical protein